MKQSFIVLAAVLGLGISSAVAADMPVKASPRQAAIDPWAGWYVGLNAGGDWAGSKDSWSNITESATGFAAGAATLLPAAANATLRSSGFIGGAQVGYNYRTGAYLLGAEADLQYTGLSSTRFSTSPTNGVIAAGFLTETFSSHWLSTIRGRAGYIAGNNWLLYGTGGLAVARVNYSDGVCFPGAGVPTCQTGTIGKTRAGWTAGVGAEWKYSGPWSVKLEYLYADLGTTTYITPSPLAATPNATITNSRNLTENIVRVGVNYKIP